MRRRSTGLRFSVGKRRFRRKRVEQSGFTFIGPRPETIRLMGDKVRPRCDEGRWRSGAFPGDGRALPDDPEGNRQDRPEIGYPDHRWRLPAAAAGAACAWCTPGALINAVMTTSGRALAAFGNGMVYMEKFLENPRHIEIQVLADEHGNAIHLGERDCSDAAPPPEIIEEAPGARHPADSARIGERCAEACRQIGYRGAGTSEFLYENGEFYFIEMNTRVQVEHPVTENDHRHRHRAGQIEHAAGEAALTQKTSSCAATRSNAASTPKTHTPSCLRPGRIATYHPPGGPGIRMDYIYYNGYLMVPLNYGLMVAKIFALAPPVSRHCPHAHRPLGMIVEASRPISRSDMNWTTPAFIRAALVSIILNSGMENEKGERLIVSR